MDTIVVIIIILLILYISFEYTKPKQQAAIGNYETRFFAISGGHSLDIFNSMKEAGYSDETILKFLTMEDKFLSLEKELVCNGSNRQLEAIDLSQQIIETFPSYDFSYHTQHIKQMAEPDKMVNKNLNCF